MKRFALVAVGALLLAACAQDTKTQQLPPPGWDEPQIRGVDNVSLPSSSESSSESFSSESSESSSSTESSSSGVSVPVGKQRTKSVTLVQRSFEKVAGAKGAAWLSAIGVVKLTGQIDTGATLHIKLMRDPLDDGKGWSALGMYLAPVAQGDGFDYPDETKYGTRLHFIDAVWRGDCQRHLSPSSSFGVIKGHVNQADYSFDAVPLTLGDDGCETGTATVNLAELVNSGGLYLGFMPSDGRYTAEIELEYTGDLQVTNMDW